MNIKRKLEITHRDIKSISEHYDEDAEVVKAALDSLITFCQYEKSIIDEAIKAKIIETLN